MVERKKSGSKLSRSETVSVRLDPRLRLAAELAAGKERRSLSSFVEWCVEQQTKSIVLTKGEEVDPSSGDFFYADKSAYEVALDVWEPEDSDAFARRAVLYPDLLTVEELITWRIVKDAPYLWAVTYNHYVKTWQWNTRSYASLKRFDLRELWPTILLAAAGDEEAQKGLNNARKEYLKSLEIPEPPPPENNDDLPF